MSSNSRHQVQCAGCGSITELEMVIKANSYTPKAAQHQLLSDVETPEVSESKEELAMMTHGQCSECGNSHWLQMGELTVTMAPIKDEKVEKPAAEKHLCVGCGETKEVDPDEMPTCSICGNIEWEKVPV